MVLETIIVGVVCIIVSIILAAGGVIGIGTWKTITLGLAEIGEAGKNVRERINVRADMAFDSEGEGEAEATGGMSELDGLARLGGYESASAALADPALMAKLGLGSKDGGK